MQSLKNSTIYINYLLTWEYTEEGLPRTFTLFLLLPFTNCRKYDDRIHVAPTTGQSPHHGAQIEGESNVSTNHED